MTALLILAAAAGWAGHAIEHRWWHQHVVRARRNREGALRGWRP